MPLTIFQVNTMLKALQAVIEEAWAAHCDASVPSEASDWLRVYDSLRIAMDRLSAIRDKK